jgi:hypothetical protein
VHDEAHVVPGVAELERWLTAGPMSMTFSCTMRTGSKRRSSSPAGSSAVRELTETRTSSGPWSSAFRPMETETVVRSGE